MSTTSKSKSENKSEKLNGRKGDSVKSIKGNGNASTASAKHGSTKTDRKSASSDLTTTTIKSQKVSDNDKNSTSKSSTEKGILKNKKTGRSEQMKKKDKTKKVKPKKKTFYEKLAQSMGFYVGNVVLRDPRAIEAAQALDLQQHHLRRLRIKFDRIDIDNSGNIDYDEFFESVGETRSPFTDKLFSLIDLDGSGTIEFDEYVRVMATYCMFTKDEILRFCFECFDVDKSGSIDEKEFVELCKCINNASPAFPANFKRALQEFDVNEDGLIDYAEFLEIDRRYPLILFPAFRLQDVMQRNSLGENGWLRVIENYQEGKRIEEYKALNGGKSPPDSTLKTAGKMFLPCLFRDRVHIKVGADMEARHRLDE